MADKVLHLTLHRKWFKQILDGTKKIEYREAMRNLGKEQDNDNNG